MGREQRLGAYSLFSFDSPLRFASVLIICVLKNFMCILFLRNLSKIVHHSTYRALDELSMRYAFFFLYSFVLLFILSSLRLLFPVSSFLYLFYSFFLFFLSSFLFFLFFLSSFFLYLKLEVKPEVKFT